MKSFKEFFLEYRHDYADGTPSQFIRPNNGKNPDRLNKKYLHTVGEYQRENPKMKVPGSILTAQELADMDIIYDHGKILNNWKNSGFGLQMTSINGEPVARVFKSRVKFDKVKPHLSMTK